MKATILGSLGWMALRLRNFDTVRNWLGESLFLRMEIGYNGGTAWCLEKLAEAAVLERQYQKAVKIFVSAASLRLPVFSVIDPIDQPEYERTISMLRAKFGQNPFKTCWEEGQAVHLNDMVAFALSEPVDLIDQAKFQGLSKRERETASLIALGKSNREIAQVMTVREKTIETYVTRILDKLGFDSRVQIATWAVKKGLISS